MARARVVLTEQLTFVLPRTSSRRRPSHHQDVRTRWYSFVKMTQDPLTWPLCKKFIRAYDSRSAGCSVMVRGDRMYEWPSRAGSECKRATGTIKTWDVQKQFGFVLCGNEELFPHVARMTNADETESVQAYGLAEGDRVEFEIEEPQRGRKGRQAINVSVLESSASFRSQRIWTPKPGDWHCLDCGFTIFERNEKCAKCHRIHSRRRSRSRSRRKCRRY